MFVIYYCGTKYPQISSLTQYTLLTSKSLWLSWVLKPRLQSRYRPGLPSPQGSPGGGSVSTLSPVPVDPIQASAGCRIDGLHSSLDVGQRPTSVLAPWASPTGWLSAAKQTSRRQDKEYVCHLDTPRSYSPLRLSYSCDLSSLWPYSLH